MTGSPPARIDRTPQGFISTEALSPLVNAWRTADRQGFTEVDAGALSYDRSIVRDLPPRFHRRRPERRPGQDPRAGL
jgi:hypothetical protein